MKNQGDILHSPSNLKRILVEALRISVSRTPPDLFRELKELAAMNKEDRISYSQISTMVKNIEYGKENLIPICQDTGTVSFFIQWGEKRRYPERFKSTIAEALEEATRQNILRPNTVDPITGKNPGTNLGENIPLIYFEPKEGTTDVTITLLNKGGGSENYCRLLMLSPSRGLEELPSQIRNVVRKAGARPCPPIILGIGLGGDALKALYLAKKALLRPLGSRNPRKEIADLEEQILNEVNKENIGIMGLGGGKTCLDVRIEWAMRHPASYPVGIALQCYSHRTISIKIEEDNTISIGHLNENFEFVKVSSDTELFYNLLKDTGVF